MSKTKEEIYNDKVAYWFSGQIGSADIREDVLEAMSEYASQCTAPLKARIRELEELLLEIDKSLYIGPDLDDTEILKWYIDVVTVIKDEIKSLLSGASSSSKTP